MKRRKLTDRLIKSSHLLIYSYLVAKLVLNKHINIGIGGRLKSLVVEVAQELLRPKKTVQFATQGKAN